MEKRLKEIRFELKEIADKEAMKLYRLARRLERRGGNREVVARIREEACTLYKTGYPERLIDPFLKWEFAFRF